jgi:hypothetical protein
VQPSGHGHLAKRLANLYAAMPSLHVAWATWCAVAVITATRSRWRHLAWLYPTATVLVVLASANHFLLDAADGLAVLGLGLLGTAGKQRGPCHGHRGVGSRPDPAGRGAPPMSTGTITARPAADAGPARAPRTAFVLAGGAALGAMQAGMVHALHERGITPGPAGRHLGRGPERRVPRLPPPPTVANAGELTAIWRGLRRSDILPLRPRMVGAWGLCGRGLALSHEPQRQRRRSGDGCVSRPGPGPLYTAILRYAVLVMAAWGSARSPPPC